MLILIIGNGREFFTLSPEIQIFMASIQVIPGNSECSNVGSQQKKPPLIRWFFLLLLLGALTISPAAAAPGWKFHADNQNTGVYDDGGTRPDGALVWNYTAGGNVTSSPAVVDGVVYAGSWDDHLYAVNATNGAFLWKYNTTETSNPYVSSSPAVVEGIVYIGGARSKIQALDADTGALLWKYTTSEQYITRAEVSSSPAVADGVVYVGNYDSNIYAFNTSTGALLWNYTVGNEMGFWSSPAVANGVVYAGCYNGKLYALDASTGTLLWQYETGGPVWSSPAVVDGVVYFGSSDKNLYALNAATGTLLWNYTTGNGVRSSPAVANGAVYVGSQDGNLYALDASTGDLLWNYTTGDVVRSSPAVANGAVYFGSWDNNLYVLDASTGTLLWQYVTGGPVVSSPAVVDGVVYFGSRDSNLYAIGSSPESPPDNVSSLHATNTRQDRITWNWTDPSSPGFSHVMVYLDGVFLENVTKGTQGYTATRLTPATAYTLGTKTVGTGGLINQTWVNSTAGTDPASPEMAWKFRSDLSNSGIYDDGGKRPEGGLLWKFTTGNGVRSSPAVVDGVVYIGSNNKNLYALDAATGAGIWNYPTGNEVFSSPMVANGVVYVGSDDQNLYALDASTGAFLWNYMTGGNVFSSTAVVDGSVYFGSWDGKLYALDSLTGAFKWDYPTGGWVISSPAVVDGVVYAGSDDGTFFALDASTGALLWNYTTGDEVESSPAVVDGVVYFGSRDNNIYALNALTGTLLWNYTTGGNVDSSPAVVNGVVYAGSYDNNVYALDASTGALLWNYTTGDPVFSSPAVANGVVYVGSLDNSLYALDASTGALLWSTPTGNMVFSSPAVSNGMVYVGSDDGSLYAFGSFPDEPPASVTDLHASTTQQLRITWAWIDPAPIGFSHVMVYLDGVFQGNVTKGIQTYTATGLTPSTTYTIGTRTVGMKGMINQTWVNQTATTSVLSLSELDPSSVMEGSPGFTLDIYGTGFTPGSTILWNGEGQTTQYLQSGHLIMEVSAEMVAYPRHVNITVYDSSSGDTSNSLSLSVTDNPSDEKAWKFRSDIFSTGVYDDGGYRPEGVLLWNYTTGGRVTSSPAVVNGVVYVGSQDRNLYAFDALTGARLWNYNTTEPNDWVSSSPAVANGIVYIGGLKTKVHALDASTGTLLWNYTVPALTTTRIEVSSSPAVANGVVYIGNYDGNIYAFNAVTGALLWNYTTGIYYYDRAVYSSPVVANGIVYVGSYGTNLYALDAATGDLLWNYTTGSPILSSPAIANGVIYFGSGDNNTYALNADTGALIWSYKTGAGVSSSPAIVNGVVYFGSGDNNIYALNADTGALIWSYKTGNRITSSPAIANGVVYVGSYDNNTYALNADTGALIWSYTTGAGVSSSPAVENGVVYFGSRDGNLYALGSPPIDGGGKGYYLIHSNAEGAEVYFNGDWFEGKIVNGTLLVETCTTCTPVWTFTVKKCGYFTLTQNNTRYPGNNETIDLYANLTSPREPLIADFISNVTTGSTPLSVGFTSRSVGIAETWNWSFGDGTYSEEEDPVHIYTTPGVYTVSLSETNSACQNNTMTKPDYITAGAPPKPTFLANFTVSPTSGIAPLKVQCTDQSIGSPTRYYYNFGDGGSSMAGPNPVHTYRYPGTYNITLTITKYNSTTNSIMGVSTTKTDVIRVSSVPFIMPVANFTASPTIGTVPLTVTFTDNSSGDPTRFNYDFGDGVNMTVPNPVHTYRYPGNYSVTLTVVKYDVSNGSMVANSSIQTDYIVVKSK